MPVNQPPFSDDLVKSTWELEVTQLANNNEDTLKETTRKLNFLLEAIKTSADFATLQTVIKDL